MVKPPGHGEKHERNRGGMKQWGAFRKLEVKQLEGTSSPMKGHGVGQKRQGP